MKRAPRSRQRHDLYAKYHDYDSEISDLLGECGINALARFASAAKAQAVARLPDDRRTATLLAFIRTLEASASDDVIDLFDVVTTTIFSNAQAASREARLRSLRDLDAAIAHQ